jgi:hypothetical protein
VSIHGIARGSFVPGAAMCAAVLVTATASGAQASAVQGTDTLGECGPPARARMLRMRWARRELGQAGSHDGQFPAERGEQRLFTREQAMASIVGRTTAPLYASTTYLGAAHTPLPRTQKYILGIRPLRDGGAGLPERSPASFPLPPGSPAWVAGLTSRPRAFYVSGPLPATAAARAARLRAAFASRSRTRPQASQRNVRPQSGRTSFTRRHRSTACSVSTTARRSYSLIGDAVGACPVG